MTSLQSIQYALQYALLCAYNFTQLYDIFASIQYALVTLASLRQSGFSKLRDVFGSTVEESLDHLHSGCVMHQRNVCCGFKSSTYKYC